jgi:hypothetical protein
MSMLETIYSKVQPEKLLVTICRKEAITSARTNLSKDDAFLQGACKKLSVLDTFKPHYHLEQDRKSGITQEAWVILEGSIRINVWDLNHEFLTSSVLDAGDCSITFMGGHSMEVLEEGTLLLEFKNGPYMGQQADKNWIKL